MKFPTLERLFTRSQRPSILTRPDVLQLLFCLLIILLHLILLASGRMEAAEQRVLDYFFRQRPALEVHPDLVVIEIDEESLQSIGQWPWPWNYHAAMMNVLHKWKAKAIVFNMLFQDSPGVYETTTLKEAIQKAENVYLPVVLEKNPGKTYWVHSLPMVLEPGGESLQWRYSLPEINEAAAGVGHINAEPDPDGVLRRIAPYLVSRKASHPYLGLQIYYDHLDRFSQSAVSLPLDSEGKLLINWAGTRQSVIPHYSFADVIRTYQALEQGRPPVLNPSDFAGKICLIGLSARGVANLKATPMAAEFPLVGVLAHVANSLLTRQFIREVPLGMNAMLLALVGMAASLLFVSLRYFASFLWAVALGVLWMAGAFLAFWLAGYWIYVLQPVLLILVLFIFSMLYSHLVASREQARLFDLATRDGLTGLFVIRYFREVVNQVTRESHHNGNPLSVILTDLDNFKPVNDTFGHAAGDYVLKHAARIIQSCLRSQRPFHETDFVARYGGEEFIVMLRNTALKDAAEKVAERIRKAIEQHHFDWEGKRIPVTISLGVGTLHPKETIPDPMIRRADEALYRSKKTGKNKVSTEEDLRQTTGS